ncbi:unnamed protein product [Pieris macdunnoughi]|uniref:Uncharacterized protein n=1 Tax=Pieris macdunnoughi TaxID=345717 RepID=A0A821Q2Q7_9NEOP|nr:unnamed protein product [Pieris macdunnoughi]
MQSSLPQAFRELFMKGRADNSTVKSGGCCFGQVCTNPCVYPVQPAPQLPVILPARTVYEPVEHDHPPLGEIKDIIRAERRYERIESDSYSDDTDSDDYGNLYY